MSSIGPEKGVFVHTGLTNHFLQLHTVWYYTAQVLQTHTGTGKDTRTGVGAGKDTGTCTGAARGRATGKGADTGANTDTGVGEVSEVSEG